MAQVELIMPKMGESVAEATIIKWLKNEGDSITLDEPLLEIATDKVDTEIPSPFEGILIKKLFNEGNVVQVGKPVALINTSANGSEVKKEIVEVDVEQKKETVIEPSAVIECVTPAIEPSQTRTEQSILSSRFYSPLVRNIAKQEGISIVELDSIAGTGAQGRVTKNDILNYLPNKGKIQSHTQSLHLPIASVVNENGHKTEFKSSPKITLMTGDEIVEMDRMRKLIADHMVMSKQVSPHVTSYVEADVTNLVQWREKVKGEFEKREKQKLTYTPIFIEALVKAIKDFPMINVSVDGTKIIIRKNINIGLAAALPSGNLIVPVLKNADRMNLFGLTATVNDLADRARTGKLVPDEIQGGTYTITNVGSFGNAMGTPIINQPQVAIMAVGAIKKKPAVIETPSGDTIGIRHMMFLSHSYDHRVVDGALGGRFLRRFADYLEQWDINREI